MPFPVKLKILPVNVEGLSSFNIPVEAAKVTDAESAAEISSVAPFPIVAAPDVCGFTVRSNGLDAALVPAEVVSVAVNA